jgi:glycine oxidase
MALPPDAVRDVVIIGGGAAGLSTAVAAAMAGASVTVLSKAPEAAALRAAAGMLAPNVEALPPGAMADLAAASRAMYPDYVQMLQRLTGADLGYVSRGDVLFPLLNGERAPAGVARAGTFIGQDALRHVESALGPSVTGAYQVPGDAQVDNRALFHGLEKACRVLGVNVEHGADVAGVVTTADGRSVDHLVLTSGERVIAGHYVAAAGAWTQGILPNVPMRPVKGQMICLEPRAGPADDGQGKLQHLLFGHGVYVVPKQRGSRFFVGATVEDAGFDRETTAGGVGALLSKALQLVPAFENYRLAESWAGLRPATPDLLPVLGLSEYSNLSVASGYHRNGVLLLPASAKIAAAVALGTDAALAPDLRHALECFSCTRFTGTAAVAAPNVKAAPRAPTAPADNVDGAEEEVLMYSIRPDGSKQPIYRGQTPSMFTQGAGDIAGEEEAIRAAAGEKRRVEKPPPPPAQHQRAEPTSAANDAYDDILVHRGKDEDAKMSASLAKNRSFGIAPRPGHENEASSLGPREWDALDAAFGEGEADASEFTRLTAEDDEAARATRAELAAAAAAGEADVQAAILAEAWLSGEVSKGALNGWSGPRSGKASRPDPEATGSG